LRAGFNLSAGHSVITQSWSRCRPCRPA